VGSEASIPEVLSVGIFWTEYGASEWTVWSCELNMLPVNEPSGIVVRVI
jgi:hypothetical protein